MIKTLEKLRKLEDRINTKKAEKKVAERQKKEIEGKLQERGIKPEDLDKLIENKKEELQTLEQKVIAKIKEANDVLDNNSSAE